MSTSDINGSQPATHVPIRTAAVYLAASVLCIAATNVYALFGHGVRSAAMDFMFLYPLLGGSLVFFAIASLPAALAKKIARRSRLGYNLYNSGIASLTSAAMLTGVMEIAGTGSRWIQLIKALGIALLAASIVCQSLASAASAASAESSRRNG